MLEILTVGFAGKSAEQFFELLKGNRVERVLDIRLRNTSQLAGFAKKEDLAYFLRTICNAGYEHDNQLAPTDELLDSVKARRLTWDGYSEQFKALMAERRPEDRLSRRQFERRTVLLCAEPKTEQCHRRLVAERLASSWTGIEVVHL